jgi:hypothetical protein
VFTSRLEGQGGLSGPQYKSKDPYRTRTKAIYPALVVKVTSAIKKSAMGSRVVSDWAALSRSAIWGYGPRDVVNSVLWVLMTGSRVNPRLLDIYSAQRINIVKDKVLYLYCCFSSFCSK